MTDLTFRQLTVSIILQFILLSSVHSTHHDYDLPVLPDSEMIKNALSTLDGPYTKMSCEIPKNSHIPKIFWITMKTVPKHYHDLPPHITQYLSRHRDWVSIIADDEYAYKFMKTVYANSSLLWAYEAINPALGAAKADIWRYAVLYACGGVYIDADATFHSSLEHYITPEDKFIISTGSKPAEQCYQSTHPLSNTPTMFGNLTVVQWMMFSAAEHPFLSQAMLNLVGVVKSIYIRNSILLPSLKPYRVIICSTGPDLFTSSVSQAINMVSSTVLAYRYAGVDYEKIGGRFTEDRWKVKSKEPDEDGPNHFAKLMNSGAPLLSSLENQRLRTRL